MTVADSGSDDAVEPEVFLRATFAAVHQLRAVDLSGLPPGKAIQGTIGWLRSLLDQVEIVGRSMELGLAHTTAPNRRQIAELVLRLAWVGEHGDEAMDALIQQEQDQAAKHKANLKSMGVVGFIPDFSDLEALELDPPATLKSAAGAVTNLAREMNASGMYRAWWFETQYAHATAYLALSLAPFVDGKYQFGQIGHAREPERLLRDLLFYGMLYAEISLTRRGVEKPGLIEAWSVAVSPILRPPEAGDTEQEER